MKLTQGMTISLVCWAVLSACGGGGSNSNASVAGSSGGSAGEAGDGDGGSTSSSANGGSSSGGTGDSGGSSAGGSDGSSTGGASSGGSSAGGSGGSNSTGGGGSGPTSDFAAFCETYADYICDWMLGCRDFPDCENSGPAALIKTSCEELLPQAIADGDLVFDAELAESCVPDSLICYGTPRDLTDIGPCRGVVQAKGKIGDACYRTVGWFEQPCAEGYCDMSDQCPGVCTEYTADGDPCDGECRPGSMCLDNVCTKLPDVGEGCDGPCLYGFPCVEGDDGKVCVEPGVDGDDCDDSHPCSVPNSCVRGVCGAKLELEDECTSSVQCPDNARCLADGESGMTCQPLPVAGEACPTGECAPGNLVCRDPNFSDEDYTTYCIEVGGVDDPCEPNGCRSDLWCYYAEDDPEGVCLPRGGAGDFCTTEGSGPFAGYPPCLSYPNLYICMDEECTAPGKVGDPCIPSDWQTCGEGWCSTETKRCVAPAAKGEVCNPVFMYQQACAEGLYCFCENDDCYFDGVSDRGECRSKKAEDAACQTALECLSDTCDFEGDTGRCTEVVDQSACDAPYAPDPAD